MTPCLRNSDRRRLRNRSSKNTNLHVYAFFYTSTWADETLERALCLCLLSSCQFSLARTQYVTRNTRWTISAQCTRACCGLNVPSSQVEVKKNAFLVNWCFLKCDFSASSCRSFVNKASYETSECFLAFTRKWLWCYENFNMKNISFSK